jgi:hypothetical protein
MRRARDVIVAPDTCIDMLLLGHDVPAFGRLRWLMVG